MAQSPRPRPAQPGPAPGRLVASSLCSLPGLPGRRPVPLDVNPVCPSRAWTGHSFWQDRPFSNSSCLGVSSRVLTCSDSTGRSNLKQICSRCSLISKINR